ncbi:MAG: phytanoyl-CoA dioxygenase family protein [Actinomycetota bacterium]|nr:phytanoyl-CoA dioxygenase family protein [Actinomycetota bacterium]
MRILTPASHDDWNSNGRLVLCNVLKPALVAEIDTAAREIEDWAECGGPGLHHFELTDNGRRIARSEDFEPYHPVMSDLLGHGIIPQILSELFGEPATLFKEKINYKHPGGGGFAPHQDATAYRFVDHHISIMMPLDRATQASGCLWFCGRQPTILPHEGGRIDPSWVDAHVWEPIEVGPGDLVFFDSYAPHHSDTNRTDCSRRAVYLTYNRSSDGDFRGTYYEDKRQVLAEASSTERVRISVNDDFLGRPA